MKIYFLIIIFVTSVMCQNLPTSPCPQVFRYEYIEDQWYGIVEAKDPPPYGGIMKIEVILFLEAYLPNSYPGKIEPIDSNNKVIESIIANYPIIYKIYYPLLNPLPHVSDITFNNKIICFGNPSGNFKTRLRIHHTFETGSQIIDRPLYFEQFPSSTTTQRLPMSNGYLENNLILPIVNSFKYEEKTTTQRSTSQIETSTPKQQSSETLMQPEIPLDLYQSITDDSYKYIYCGETGKVKITIDLIHHGDTIDRGQWPWLVALFRRKRTSPGTISLTFICGSTLISEKLILTAAHCVIKYDNLPVRSSDLLLKLGIHNLDDDSDETTVIRGVSKIHVPLNYTRDSNFYDIAVLVMTREVVFNQFIRPVCLWEDNDDQRLIEGIEGKVVGWGQDEEEGGINSEPKMVSVPIVSTNTCRNSNEQFFRYTAFNTICAGSRNGAGPCRGDSGGGLYIKHQNHWVIRGIVSQSLRTEDRSCDLKEYAIYTDCAKFVNWILSIQ